MEQAQIPISQPSLSDTFSLATNRPLYMLLSNGGLGFVINLHTNHRLSSVVMELLNYIKKKKLFQYPTTVHCDEPLKAALGVSRFQIYQICDVIYQSATLEPFPRYGLYEEFLTQSSERVAIMKLIFEIAQEANERYLF